MTERPFTLYLARHGETDYNRRKLMQGRSIDASLNEVGIRQAEALSGRMAGESLDAIYASTLKRAQETADLLASPHQLKPRILPDLVEMAWGDLEGTPIADHTHYLKEVGEAWKAGGFDHQIGGGESILDVERRAKAAWAHINQSHSDGQTAFAVTHGRFMRVLLTVALADHGLSHMDRFPHSNTGVYRLDRTGSVWKLMLMNCTAHLEVVPQ
ncbi:MAG: broad specificity phosphatase PhoE [Rhodothermales bacterium]|jgi:broad specificity phosphatase PhoE